MEGRNIKEGRNTKEGRKMGRTEERKDGWTEGAPVVVGGGRWRCCGAVSGGCGDSDDRVGYGGR
jgi:hypothetical protein